MPVTRKLKLTAPSALTNEEARERFRKNLFSRSVLEGYKSGYVSSTPYKHSVISNLIDDALLRRVRKEIRANVSFTPKETDIYKIHQSGDLANLDGLDDEALGKLPSLLALRDAMYSDAFRSYISTITGCGPLSGRKTDMAINVYTPGCFLLCHDDVIGSRKVSYILYLTDPDTPWQAEWGGALRLFPVMEKKGQDGEVAKTVSPDHVKVIPPAWNQLSFFAVQPGESFHDVEEVYHAETAAQLKKEGGHVRMAISGWFHIPQIGEEGYIEGAEEAQAENSSLMQLQGNPDQHDLPQAKTVPVKRIVSKGASEESQEFSQADLEFLLKYIAPTYLIPDTIMNMADHFEENSSITISDILQPKFAAKLKEYIEKEDSTALPESQMDIEKKTSWKVARPPHKHRFVYQQQRDASATTNGKQETDSPLRELIDGLFPSEQFRKWLELVTESTVESHDLVARRFRRGKDYTLATGHDGKPRLEVNLGMTPTEGWGDDTAEVTDDEEAETEDEADYRERKTNGNRNGNSLPASPKGAKGRATGEQDEQEEVGGHEVYMAGDDDGTEDAAIYKSGGGDEDDNILFFQAPAWNKMTIVLRDSGALRFVKYVSRKAPGDRWDISATFEIEEKDDDDDDDDENGDGKTSGAADDINGQIVESEEEEFRGFSPSEDSDSD